MAIFNIRGTHGSGKTYLVERLLTEFGPAEPTYWEGRRTPKVAYYWLPQFSLSVLGDYSPHRKAGGCDTIQPFDLIEPLLRERAAVGHVVFEGVICTSVVGRW